MSSRVERLIVSRVVPYLQILRVDHWFKNAFMALGVVLAFFWRPELLGPRALLNLVSAFFCTCVVASSNYVLNEFLDAPTDRQHPIKRNRPAARGDVTGWAALLLWGALGLLGIEWGFAINVPFGGAAFGLWVMGCIYNIPPLRSKEVAFVDVLTESINNPLRLLLGWFALIPDRFPPLSLAIAYWMVGAFFMATKRFAELRSIPDREQLLRYRRSFRGYDESRLLASMVFYLVAGAVMGGIFVVRYKVELILGVPFYAGFFAYYMSIGMRKDSPVQHPERLYRESAFFVFALLTTIVFIGLMFLHMPALYDLFGVQPAGSDELWKTTR